MPTVCTRWPLIVWAGLQHVRPDPDQRAEHHVVARLLAHLAGHAGHRVLAEPEPAAGERPQSAAGTLRRDPRQQDGPVTLAPGIGAQADALDDAVAASEVLGEGRRERRGGRHEPNRCTEAEVRAEAHGGPGALR